MKSEALKTELTQAEEAELESDAQLRGLIELINDAAKPDSRRSAPDCHKLVSAALDLNARLKARTEQVRKELKACETVENFAARKAGKA